MSEGPGVEVDVDLRFAAAIGGVIADRVVEAVTAGRKERGPRFPPGVLFPSSGAVVLTTGAPQLGLSIGPLMGWAWRVTRIQINNAVAGVGANPAITQPPVPASGQAVQNNNLFPVNVTLSGFTLTAVTVNGINVGSTNGTYLVPSAGSIAVTYTVAGTWSWVNANPAPSTGLYTVYRDKGLGLQDVIQPQAGPVFTPNGTYDPPRLWVRYPYAFNAVGSGLAANGQGLMVVDFINVREDWLADAVG